MIYRTAGVFLLIFCASLLVVADDRVADAEALSAKSPPTADDLAQYSRETAQQLSEEACDKGWDLLYQKNDKIRAMDEFNKAWRLDPNNFQAYWGCGLVYGMIADEKGNRCEQYLQDSIKLLEKSRELVVADAAKRNVTTGLVDAYNKIGVFYLDRDNKDQADIYFAKSKQLLLDIIKADPSYGYAHYLLSTVFFYQHDFSQAVKEAELAEKNGYTLPDDFKAKIQKYTPQEDQKTDKNQYGFLLFPVNLGPDIVTNTLLCYGACFRLFFEYPDEPAWGVLALITTPIAGIYHGFADAIEGYPFWSSYILRSDYFSPCSRDPQK